MEHYFTDNPNLKSEIRELIYKHKGNCLSFFSDNGVFAKNKIDYASSLLLESFLDNINNKDDPDILDVGCGYGFLGITISKILNANVDMIDVNKRAIHLTEINIKQNEVKGNAFLSNMYENVNKKYNYIITNPPIRAGKDIYINILKNAKNYLKNDGELWFVMSKDQGAKSTKNVLEGTYNIECITKSKGFYVYKAKCA